MKDKKKRDDEERRKKKKLHEEDNRLCQTSKEKKKKNVASFTDTRTKLVEIQTAKKKKQKMLADLSGQVKSVVARNKYAEMQKVDHKEIVAKTFGKEI